MKSLAELIELAVLFVFGVEKHKNVNVAYAAEDGNVFTDENRAKIHVKDKEMKYHTITRTEAEGTQPEKKVVDELDENLIAEKTKELEELELVSANYQKMKSLVLFFGIETPDLKADTLIDALTQYKTKISA
jgi:hypothetical protein